MYKQFAKGSFTRAYTRDGDPDNVYLASVCPVKYAMSQNPDITRGMFPEIEEIERFTNQRLFRRTGLEVRYYKMRKYTRSRAVASSLVRSDYKRYRKLKGIYDVMYGPNANRAECVNITGDDYFRCQYETAVNWCRLYVDDLRMEISPRNIAFDGNRLVLLDIFYCGKTLKRMWDDVT